MLWKKSMVVPGETGTLVAPGNVDELAAAIEPMLADPAGTAEVGTRGRARACARFSIESEARGIAAAIDRLR
jgi:mannosyltransferase